MLDLNFFRDFDELDQLVSTISRCCKSRHIDPMSQEGRSLIGSILDERVSARILQSERFEASLRILQTVASCTIPASLSLMSAEQINVNFWNNGRGAPLDRHGFVALNAYSTKLAPTSYGAFFRLARL